MSALLVLLELIDSKDSKDSIRGRVLAIPDQHSNSGSSCQAGASLVYSQDVKDKNGAPRMGYLS